MNIKQIYLTYQLKEVMKFNQPIKIIYNLQSQQTILIKDGKFIIEYNYGQLIELGKIEIKFKESKLGINVTYCDKFEIYFILFEGLQLYIIKKKMILMNIIKFDSKYTVGLHYFNGHLLLLGLEEIDLLKFEFIIKKKDPKIEGEITKLNNIKTNQKYSKIEIETTKLNNIKTNEKYSKIEGETKKMNNIKTNQKYSKTDQQTKRKESDKLPDIKVQHDGVDTKKDIKKDIKKPRNSLNEIQELNKIQEEDKCKYLAKDNFDFAHINKKSVYASKEWNLGFYINDEYLFFWGARDLTIMKQVIIEQFQNDWENDNFQGFSSWFNRAKLQLDDQFEGNCNTVQTITYQLVQRYHDITKHENLITSLLHFLEFRYFVTGFETGQLKLWKINNAVKKSELLVHSYEGHSRQIESLVRSKNDIMFWSQGQDFIIKLWDIQSFTNVYSVNIVGIYTGLQLLTRSRFLLRNETEMFIGYLNNNLKIYRTINSKIISYFKYFNSLILTFDNTPGLQIFENKEPLIMYPPPKSMEIRQIVTDGNFYFMLLEAGLLFINSNSIQLQCLQSEEIMDFDGYHMVQIIVSIYLPKKIKIPCYDADFGQSREQYCDEQIIFGMSKGSVIVVRKLEPKKIFARMSYHREKVINIAEIDNYLLTYCSEGLLKLVLISDKSIKCLRSFNSNQQISFLVTNKNKALFFTFKGPFQIFKLKNEELILFSEEKGNDHESQVLSIDFINSQNQYLTAAADGKIKLWSSRKILLIQLILEDNLEGAWILNDSLFLAHSGKISYISIEDSKLSTQFNLQKNKYKILEKNQVKFEEFYKMIKEMFLQLNKQQNEPNKQIIINEIQQKGIQKSKQKIPVSYLAGKIFEENNKPVILYKGKESNLDSSNSPNESEGSEKEIVVQQHQSSVIKQNIQPDLLHDWQGLQEYVDNRINRFQPISALPKLLLNSVDRKRPSRQRIISRRDLTLQRIILQSINQ